MIEGVIAFLSGALLSALVAFLYLKRKRVPEVNPPTELLLVEHSKMMQRVSHHWRQPLNALSLMIQDLQDAYEYKELDAAYLEKMTSESMALISEMSVTIDQFKNYYHEGYTKEEVELTALLKEILSTFSTRAKSRNTQLLFYTNTESDGVPVDHLEEKHFKPIMIQTYQEELRQSIIELINNAFYATLERDDARIEVTLMSKKRSIEITISDNGVGIDGTTLSKLFQPYFTTKSVASGSGLGLYMIKLIIEQNLGGKIEVENSAKTHFHIQLPKKG